MTKTMPRTTRTLDLALLAAATGGMSISLTPKTTVSTGSTTTSTGPTSESTSSPTTSTSSGSQISNGIQ